MKARRFFSVRDKDRNGTHRRNKSSEADPKARIHAIDVFSWLARSDATRNTDASSSTSNPDKENEKSKVDEVLKLLGHADITNIPLEYVHSALQSEYAAGDVAKAAEFLEMAGEAYHGKIRPYNPQTHLVGAVNREYVTCYLDSLLFAMFARMTAYETMFKNEFTNESQRRLATLLRLWINMLRTGKLIPTDITKLIQEALADCGWPDARLVEQQDTSEAFAFITETLQLPLLQLQVDLFHHGKNDDDDHKVVQERLLNLAVPPDPEGKGVRLEDCLEDYFNAQVDVLRDSQEDRKETPRPPALPRLSTIRLVPRDSGLGSASPDKLMTSPVAISPIRSALPENLPTPSTPVLASESAQASPSVESHALFRHRSGSVIQSIVVNDEEHPPRSDRANVVQKSRRKSSTVVKAVTIPAWQFFRLIPWHAVGNHEPQNNLEVAMNFNQRPVVGICLKRYRYTEQHLPERLNTYIDIPDSMRLPHFMLADEKHLEEDPNGFSTEYKLVLQSVVCHRGDSVNSGHYISFARVEPRLLTGKQRDELDPPPAYEEARWVKFDDLQFDNRVSYVDDFKQALKDEMPYLLFYQIVPMVEVATSDETETEPPSYNDSKASLTASTAPSLADSTHLGSSRGFEADYFEPAPRSPPKSSSLRFSSDAERPRLSFDDDLTDSREMQRGRLRPSDSTLGTPARTPDTVSPSITPAITPSEESARDRFSRAAAAALFASKSRSRPPSRPPSQSGEGRISLTMNRLGGLIRPGRDGKDAPRDSNALSTSISGPPVSNGGPAGPEDLSARPSTDLSRISFDSDSKVELNAHTDTNLTPKKHGHWRGKSKQKGGGDQPERECILM